MNKITDKTIQDLKQANVIEVVGAFLELKKKGPNNVACCPFHDEKTPSFTVKDDFYKCFGCGVSGDAVQFIKEYKKVTFVEACETVGELTGIPIEYEENESIPQNKPKNKPKKDFKRSPLKENTKKVQSYSKPQNKATAPKKEVIEFFQKRGISPDTLTLARISQEERYFHKAGTTPSANFNYFRNGELINIKHRSTSSKDFGLQSGCELVLYNMDNVDEDKNNPLIIVEGEIDCLSVMEVFGNNANVVSVPNGASSGQNQNLKYLDCPKSKEIIEGRELRLLFDNDNAGKMLTDAFIKRFGEENCFIPTYPEGCKDANDVLLLENGREKLEEVVNSMEYPRINGILQLDDFEHQIDNYFEYGYPKCDGVGIEGIDNLIKFRGGELTMVTGISGSGKSEVLDEIAVRLASIHDWRFGVCSMENPPALHFIKLAEKYINKPFRQIVDTQTGEIIEGFSKTDLQEAKAFVMDRFNFISHKVEKDEKGEQHRGPLTLDYIIAQAKTLVRMFGIKGLMIDPWNTIEHQFAQGETETNYVSKVLSKIIAFAEDYNVHVFMVAHPTKGVTVNGVDRVASLNDISGSGNFFNKTHNGISVFREKDTDKNPENIVEVHIQKIKFKFVGSLGKCFLKYDRITGRYTHFPDTPNYSL